MIMKVYGYLSSLILFSMLVFNASLMAQDDLYFDPSTDENFQSYESDEYGESDGDEYVDDAFDDNDYYNDDEFFYSRRIRRFNRPYSSLGYYDPWFTNNSYIDPFYYSNGPGFYMGFGNSFASNPMYGVYNPYGFGGYNPYAFNNQYLDPCFNPYYNSYYSPYGYYGNPYYNGNNGYNPYNDYSYTPSNFGPRRGTGGTVDAQGNGRMSNIKEGRDGANGENLESEDNTRGAATLNAGDSRGTTLENGNTRGNGDTREVIEVGVEEESTRGGKTDSEIKVEPTTKPTRTTRSSRSNTRSSRSDRTPRSSTRSSSSSRSDRSSSRSSSNDRSSSSSSRSSGSSSSSRSSKSPR